jgi:hypothetical protein
MKKLFALSVVTVIIITTGSCKKSSAGADTSTITLSINNITYASINSCNTGGLTGSPNAMNFTVSDPGNKMTAGTWSLMEQAGAQSANIVNGAVKNGNTVTFTGCIRFGTDNTVAAKYYITTTGINSNTVNVTFTRPAGAN